MERMISGTVRRTCRFQVERAFSILNEMTKLPRTFDDFADHRRIAENILRLLREDERVLGVYLSGSFVRWEARPLLRLGLVPVDAETASQTDKAGSLQSARKGR